MSENDDESVRALLKVDDAKLSRKKAGRTQEMNVSLGDVTSDILPCDERNNPQVAEDDDESIPDLE